MVTRRCGTPSVSRSGFLRADLRAWSPGPQRPKLSSGENSMKTEVVFRMSAKSGASSCTAIERAPSYAGAANVCEKTVTSAERLLVLCGCGFSAAHPPSAPRQANASRSANAMLAAPTGFSRRMKASIRCMDILPARSYRPTSACALRSAFSFARSFAEQSPLRPRHSPSEQPHSKTFECRLGALVSVCRSTCAS